MENIEKLRNMTAIYLTYQGKILLLHRHGSKVVDNMWVGAAGGHFEEYELNNAKACVLRELEEELAVTEEMICNLQLRYVSLRWTNGEIRQNYYFFADLKEDIRDKLFSNEGELKWFDMEELSELNMPFSAQYMMEHYINVGRHNDKLYGGVADGTKVVFIEMPEF